MQITWIEARRMEEKRNRPTYKNICKKKGENALFERLKADYKDHMVVDKPIKAYIEELKQEIAEEKLQQQSK